MEEEKNEKEEWIIIIQGTYAGCKAKILESFIPLGRPALFTVEIDNGIRVSVFEPETQPLKKNLNPAP